MSGDQPIKCRFCEHPIHPSFPAGDRDWVEENWVHDRVLDTYDCWCVNAPVRCVPTWPDGQAITVTDLAGL